MVPAPVSLYSHLLNLSLTFVESFFFLANFSVTCGSCFFSVCTHIAEGLFTDAVRFLPEGLFC